MVTSRPKTHRGSQLNKRSTGVKVSTRLAISRRFTNSIPPGSVFDSIPWVKADAQIKSASGEVLFEQKDVEFPKYFSQTAINIAVQHYFKGRMGTPERETSLKQVVNRVADTMADWGSAQGYFLSESEFENFRDELKYILVHQMASFNSPVYYNVGVRQECQGWCYDFEVDDVRPIQKGEHRPQGSACLPARVMIPTEQGYKPIIWLRDNIGTKVWDGQTWTKVLAFAENGDKMVKRLSFPNGSYLDVTDEHILPAKWHRKQTDFIDQSVSDTEEGDYLARDLNLKGFGSDTTVNEVEAFLLGWLLTDGFCGRSPTSTSFTWEFSAKTGEESKLLEALMPHWVALVPGYDLQRMTSSVTKNKEDSKPITRFRGYGQEWEVPALRLQATRTSYTSEVPTFIFSSPKHVVSSFLRAAFEADGGIIDKGVQFSSVSEAMVRGVARLLDMFGIEGKIGNYQDQSVRDGYTRARSWTFTISAKRDLQKFQEYVGFATNSKRSTLDVVIHHKKDSHYKRDGLINLLVNSIDDLEVEPVFDIQTESGYFVADGIRVHNCFILKVEDSMASILNWYVEEGMVFKFGSGAGLNISPIRSKAEYLRGGGKPSGPLSFAKAADVSAGTIKSGGKTRRAAKMLIMNADHPDIEEFIWCKAKEEKKARALIEAGFSAEFNVDGGAYESVFFQNANNSIRVTDEFMKAVVEKKSIPIKAVMDGRSLGEKKADDLMTQTAQAAWACGDPGIQFDTTINRMNTCMDTERINGSNPCSEYMFLDNTACNLASLNLMKFLELDPAPSFLRADFKHACEVMAMAQEILVSNAGYPTEKIAERSHYYRTLGLGYANLGSLLMHYGYPYDSEEGRDLAACITSLMSASAYRMSAEIAERKGPFPKFKENQRSTVRVMRHHLHSAESTEDLFDSSEIWSEVCDKALSTGLRNAQISVLAPTGTIGFLMDCDTTGVEPELALVKYKKMVGGGQMKLVNSGVPAALKNLGYDEHSIEVIVAYIAEKGTIEGAPFFKEQHLDVFDCSFPAPGFTRSIHYDGHIKMMGAVQPFISGAISKTVNMPENSTVDEIQEVYKKAWKLGIKAVAIYRDNCKASQPMSTGQAKAAAALAKQRKMPSQRNAIIHEFRIANHKGFLTVGLYEDGSPGEIFIDMSKEGSTVSGLLDSTAIAVSYALQYGVPLEKFISKFAHMRFEPSGFTGNPDLPMAESVIDYVFRYLESIFGEKPTSNADPVFVTGMTANPQPAVQAYNLDAPTCDGCGNPMTRNGSCYKCGNCGKTSGCS